MANNARNDRFGNPYKLVGLKDKKGNGFPSGYVEIGNKTYKCTISPSNKDGVEHWLTVTQMKKRTASNF